MITMCPTPYKRLYLSKREAKRRRRHRYLRPYLCRAGDHWHLTKDRKRKRTAR